MISAANKPPTTEPTSSVILESPIGDLLVEADAEGLRALRFLSASGEVKSPRQTRHLPPAASEAGPGQRWLEAAAQQLTEYFAGNRRTFDLPFSLRGTPFHDAVWQKLAEIEFGQTWSYGHLATRLGRPRAVRAVGRANGLNPLPILLPCHRVIGGDGTLTGYAGGLARKRWLLDHEQSLGPLWQQ